MLHLQQESVASHLMLVASSSTSASAALSATLGATLDSTLNTSLSTSLGVVYPQPSLSTPLRTVKVIEQLQSTYDQLENKILLIQSQLTSIREAKSSHEAQSQHFLTTNQDYRANIQELMQVLHSKQLIVTTTKTTSTQLEAQVKQLKTQALSSRQQLQDLFKKETLLEQDRNTTVTERTCVEQQQKVLRMSVQALFHRYDCETHSPRLAHDLALVQHQIQTLTSQTQLWTQTLENQVKQETARRKEWVGRIERNDSRLRATTQTFVVCVLKELELLRREMESFCGLWDRRTLDQWRNGVQCLVLRINVYVANHH
ncbi:hypothetical protein BDF14DRAFT_1862495 [Spinellus fusiger]|nr:hypothetical protein BDF14DRAFT_1862495 [Spinellus fusiger]